MDGLQAFTPKEIRDARRAYLADSRRCRVKPKVGDIRGLILAERARIVALQPKPVAPPRPTATAEERARADEIIRQAGIALRSGSAQ